MPQDISLSRIADDAKPRVVLDTQVVLDWLVFHDAGCAALSSALEAGCLRWLASQAMRDELEHVLGRRGAVAWRANRQLIAQAYDRYAKMVAPETVSSPSLRCTDADDQMFIDLALSADVRWLFTRDRALLALARRAKPLGVTILKPADWPHHVEVELS